VPAPVIALIGWLVPGLGYVACRQVSRGVTVGVTILAIYVLGLLIGGVRVVDVPGYDNAGAPRNVGPDWALRARPVAEIGNKPWYVPQILAGPVTLVAGKFSLDVARAGIDPSTARLRDIGTLYTAVAGMLNLIAVIDCTARAGRLAAAARGDDGGGDR
jgi:hypothetical protein